MASSAAKFNLNLTPSMISNCRYWRFPWDFASKSLRFGCDLRSWRKFWLLRGHISFIYIYKSESLTLWSKRKLKKKITYCIKPKRWVSRFYIIVALLRKKRIFWLKFTIMNFKRFVRAMDWIGNWYWKHVVKFQLSGNFFLV